MDNKQKYPKKTKIKDISRENECSQEQQKMKIAMEDSKRNFKMKQNKQKG